MQNEAQLEKDFIESLKEHGYTYRNDIKDRANLEQNFRRIFEKRNYCHLSDSEAALVTRLLSDDYKDKVIVTTIQKLGLALNENSVRNEKRKTKGKETYAEILKPLRDKRVVIIFDECHRSQFGENHQLIKEFFPKAQLFGFTGTPIFPDNAVVRQISGMQRQHAGFLQNNTGHFPKLPA